MKAAEHELKGGMAFLDCRIVNLRLPLMALIRYRGHCILAESIIPVGQDSLIYGSRDGGVTLFASNSEMNEKIRLAAKHINLKAHRVWNRSKTKSAILHAPIDLEGHIGRDGLFYVIDTARVFPPVAPLEGSRRGSYLYKLFRPEFVRLNPVPLSSDAYSKFGRDSEAEHNEEVLEATIRLEGQVIPDFAKYLDGRYADSRLDTIKEMKGETGANVFEEDLPAVSLARHPYRQLEELSHLVAEMHLRGINLRYALAIHGLLSSTLISRLVLTEVVARSAKHLIDDMWRGIDSVSTEVYRKETANFFTTMFSLDSDSAEFWNSVLAAEVDDRFGDTLRRFRTPEMALSVDGPSPNTSLQGFSALRNSNPSNDISQSTTNGPSSSSIASLPSNTEEPRPLRLSNPRNQIRSTTSMASIQSNSPAASLNSDTCLNVVDGSLLRKGVDPTLLFFRICQLCGIELDFVSWNLPTPPELPSSFSLHSQSSIRNLILTENPRPPLLASDRSSQPLSASTSDVEDSSGAEGSHEDSLASAWIRVEHFFGTTWTTSLSASLLPSSTISTGQTSIKQPYSSALRRDIPVAAIKRIVARTKYLNRISYEEGTALSRLALSKTGSESFELLARANRKFRECLEIKPDDSRALLNWALVLTKQAELLGSSGCSSIQGIGGATSAQNAAMLWKDAFSKYESALVLRPTDWRALTNWGTALSSRASRVPVAKEGIALFRAAIEKFDRALKLLPFPHFHTSYNAANARLKLARLLLDDLRATRTIRAEKSQALHRECADLLSISITRFQESLEIEGTNVNAMHNLAVALATQARIVGASGEGIMSTLSQIAERDRLYQAAYLIYQRAIHLIPTSVDIYYGWGNALFRHALARREGPHSDDKIALQTMCDAATRYQAAIVISEKEDSTFSRDVFINFGNVLMLAAKIAHRLKEPLSSQFMGCCTLYLSLIDQPRISESESSSISQVLLSFKRYLPKESPTSPQAAPSLLPDALPPKSPASKTPPVTPKSKPQAEVIAAKATVILSQMGESGSSSSENGNVLSGSGGNSNYEQVATSRVDLYERTHPAVAASSSKRDVLKKKSKPASTSSIINSSAHLSSNSSSKDKESITNSTSSSTPLQKKKSVKTIAFESSPKSPTHVDHKVEVKANHNVKESSPSGTHTQKKPTPTPKLELSKSQPGSANETASKSSRSSGAESSVSPLSPTSQALVSHSQSVRDSIELTVSPSDSIASSGRRGTTSRLKQRLGSLFGIRSKSPSSGAVSPVSNSASSPSINVTPPGSGAWPPKTESLLISPKSPSQREDSLIFQGTSPPPIISTAANTTPTPLAASTTPKTRTKKKPARSLSNIEEVRPRASSGGTNSSNTITTSSGSSKKELDSENQDSISPGRGYPRTQFTQLQEPAQSTENALLSVEANIPTRSRRKSDADSHIPLRRQSTANIQSPRSKNASILTQSSPMIARTKTASPRPGSPQIQNAGVGDYSSISSHSIQQNQQQSIQQSPVGHGNAPTTSSSATSSDIAIQGLKQQVGSSVSLTASGGASREEKEAINEGSPSVGTKKSRRKSTERKSSLSGSSSKKDKIKSPTSGSSSPSTPGTKRKSRGHRDRKSASVTASIASNLLSQSSSTSSTLPTTIYWDKSVMYMESGEKDVKESDFIVRGVLGTSRSGLVFAARRGEEDYAMKVRLPEVITAQKPKLTPIFDHPFFTKLKCLLLTESKLIMAFNLVRGPQLLEYVMRAFSPPRDGPRLDHLVFNLVAAQLVSAISYMSEVAKIPYRDFKPSNILINDTGNIILTTHCEEDQLSLSFTKADVSFLAPEIVIKIRERRALAGVLGRGASKTLNLIDDATNRVEDDRAVWWSLGMYLLVIATGSNPFYSEDPMKMEENVLRKKFSIPQNLGKLSALLGGLLDRDITARLCSPEQVRKHPYFHNVDWTKLSQLGYHPPFLPNIQNVAKKSILSESSQRSLTSSKTSLNSSSMDTSLDLSSTAGQIALMNTMVMPDVGNQLEGNTMFIQNTSMIEDQLCASSSASESGDS
jgi:serine/threonine protein kinase/tetratricopeptide (TPR) repeat protein